VLLMQQSDLIVLNGAGYEPWLDRISLPRSKVLDTSSQLADQTIFTDSVTHQHGPEGDHSHAASAFTWWLDPLLALEQARAIESALIMQLPTDKAAIQQRYASLAEDIQKLHQQWDLLSTSLHQEPILFSHPVYQYFERRYQLNGRSLHWEPDEDPSAREWSALEELLKSHPATIMVWEQAPLLTTRDRLDAMGVQIVVIDPGAVASEADYLAVQRANIKALQELLAARSGQL
jgi:zinc transport system substrate-binding protein